ncbi:hypothetical protein sscle_16g108590 [Sclerotinia sclerotiorum 1980 UF-70]|uniref:VIT domain-containing protein n=1 Tax=Sclerotinia sclerotiorum (strain ATCC 18683 / 1980 / Ss-1) TaxID=665079 RepID=A0A1D9QMJ2_SCLS1|nr:hypothetical protein sscle_16g108590 [Sclerotinia sclerotiorum 1980 UF-70]
MIVSRTFKTVLQHTFVNSVSSGDGQSCEYRFPIYDSISVVGFNCKVGSRCLYGFVKGKQQAEAIFDAAATKGDTAGIISQSTLGADVFATKIGIVPAGERVSVEITYIGELKQDVYGIHFTIPTLDRSPLCPIDHIAVDIKITVDVILPEGQIIKGIESQSHMIATSIGTISTATQEVPKMNRASAILSHVTAGLEKDFILAIHSDDMRPYALLETHPTIPNYRALGASFITQFSPPDSSPPSPSEIVFVAEYSSHMRAHIPMIVLALNVFLKPLPTNVKFNIRSFRTKDDFLWPQSKNYSSETLQEAMQYIKTFDASYGGMGKLKVIKDTIDSRLPEIPLETILLTSGNTSKEIPLIAYVSDQVEKAQGKIRIFCLEIGNTVSGTMIERLLRIGNGFSQCVQHGERLDASVIHILREALSPHIADAIFEVKYEEDDDFELVDEVTDKMEILLSKHEESTIPSPVPGSNNKDTDASEPCYPPIIQAPHKIPGLFADTRTTAYLLMCPRKIQRRPKSITLRRSSADEPPILEIPIQVLPGKGTTIHQLAARKAMEGLEDFQGWMYNQKTSESQTLAEKEAVQLGETFQVMNRWCSFVAVVSSDKEILDKKSFPPNLPDAKSTSIIIPPPSPLKSPETNPNPAPISAIYNRRPNMDRRPIWSRPNAILLPPGQPIPSASHRIHPCQENPHVPVVFSNPNTTKILSFIDLQSFDGSWDAHTHSETLSSILEFEIPKPGLSKVIDADIWVTVLVVRFLEIRIPEEKNVWCLIVEKARRFVRVRLNASGDMDLLSLEEMAGAAVLIT